MKNAKRLNAIAKRLQQCADELFTLGYDKPATAIEKVVLNVARTANQEEETG